MSKKHGLLTITQVNLVVLWENWRFNDIFSLKVAASRI